jgi:hypothetical protein
MTCTAAERLKPENPTSPADAVPTRRPRAGIPTNESQFPFDNLWSGPSCQRAMAQSRSDNRFK